ncbi:polymorphic toxin type 47 domain-containing protein [Acinetobacter soli]|uniref:polymorphic toxin type 47 domain-containing protein n=1 Tax=Acinetobacter soli TaxID=487316 RepID=UPI00224BA701|nr:polymorphic toxin type 47 domain-containing protein [Acinetobacter soli]WOQ35593.1 polymorphic toxin type 47 domain-containing protein [Acinetobacter soli]
MQGKGVQVDAKALNIESLQNTATYNSTQQNIEGQVTVGIGTGVPKNEFTVTKWAVDQNGKSFPAEYRVLSGSNRGTEVSVDLGHTSSGTPGAPHVGWQTPGKKNTVGHIFLDNVNVNRSKSKD